MRKIRWILKFLSFLSYQRFAMVLSLDITYYLFFLQIKFPLYHESYNILSYITSLSYKTFSFQKFAVDKSLIMTTIKFLKSSQAAISTKRHFHNFD